MNNIHIDIRLRPIRFGFLVRPNDKANVLEIFRINTCLWGGVFNPIIPFFKRVPPWWERHGYCFENAKQIINGYLDFFEPDVLVEAEEGLADGFGFDPRRVLQLADILERPEEGGWDRYGLSVHDLYGDLYTKEFQFEQRHKYNVVHVKPTRKAFANFVAANFGSFPIQEEFEYFERNYKGIFDSEDITLDGAALLKLYQSGYTSALRIGYQKLQIDYHDCAGLTLFILDIKESKDLVDFWNLRAIYEHIIAIPVQWIKELSPFCKKPILDNYRPQPGNPNGVMIHPTSMFSRSIPEDDIEEIHKNYLRVDEKDANIPKTWYPAIWDKPSELVFRATRPTLEADRKKMDTQIDGDNSEIRFDPLFPEFASEYGYRSRVANVIRFKDWSNTSQTTTVFPCNYKNPTFPKFRFGMERPLPTTEGLVIFPEYGDISKEWNLVDGTTAFNQWFNGNQVPATLSDAGRATQQIIQTLGGCGGVGCLAHKGIIELLNEMSRSPITKTAHYKEFNNEINNAIDNKRWRKGIFETLVHSKVVELGLELKCNKCGSWSWYSVTQLDYSLTCDLCLKQFDFPVTRPLDGKHSKWAYRVVGPFALPDYARGGYAAALAIRFFANVIDNLGRSAVTWSSGQELELPTGEKVEADFILWHQRKEVWGTDWPTETVFGEAKSFGKDVFKQDDIDRMKWLAETFPGSILVFATMREGKEFGKKEINRISKLAEWGREYDQERQQTRAPVIVLTGTELFATNSLQASWKEKGGKHEDLIKPPSVRTDNLRVLANLTQQLYLGMPSYDSFIRDKIEKKRERSKGRLTQ